MSDNYKTISVIIAANIKRRSVMKRCIMSVAVALVFAVSVRAQEVTTVTRYVYVQPPQPVVTRYVYVQPSPPPIPRISLGDVILGAAIVYGLHEISHGSHHGSHYRPRLIRVPSHNTPRISYSRPRPMRAGRTHR